MTETALSEKAMRDSLLDIRLPSDPASAFYADLMLAAGLGGFAALILVGLAQLMSRRGTTPDKETIQERIAFLQTLPDDVRRVGFLYLLQEIAPERYSQIKPALYRPNTEADPEKEVVSRV